MTNKQKLRILCRIRTDLQDDAGQITSLNSAIRNAAEDFSYLVNSAYSISIKRKIEALQEPYQGNDRFIQNAKSYCQYEINHVCNEMENDD